MKIAQSSHIQAHDYDQGSQTLTIQFTNGAVYQYAGVPSTEYYNFSQSSSPGVYFHSKIKGRYSSRNIIGGDKERRRNR